MIVSIKKDKGKKMKIFTDENQFCSNLIQTKDTTVTQKMYIDKYLLSQPVCDYWNNILEQIHQTFGKD